MKTAKKIIVYDDTCPMCNWYTSVFIKTGLLEKNGRQSFSEIPPELLNRLDKNLCKDEIPLIDLTNNKVMYGTDALLEIVGGRFPLLKKIFLLKLFKKAIKFLYKLISLNRRTITAPTFSSKGFDCTPALNVKYRILWIIIGLGIHTIILIPLQKNVLSNSFLSHASLIQVQLGHAFLILSNISAALFLNKEKTIEFLGQMNMLCVIATLLYIPLILLNKAFLIPTFINNGYLFLIIFVVLKEYIRRMSFASMLPLNNNIVAANLLSLIAIIISLLK